LLKEDQDLVFIEEAFERLLLDYDRVFSAMGVPACLWRRTGEIYKGNREFCELVGLDGAMMREVRSTPDLVRREHSIYSPFRGGFVSTNSWLRNRQSTIGR
jgi:PAS domain-containing protein